MTRYGMIFDPSAYVMNQVAEWMNIRHQLCLRSKAGSNTEYTSKQLSVPIFRFR